MKKDFTEYFTSDTKFIFWANGTSTFQRHKIRKWDAIPSHRAVFHRVLNKFNEVAGYEKDDKSDPTATVRHYSRLWHFHRFGHNQYFHYDAEVGNNGFTIEFYYLNSRDPNWSTGARYNLSERKHFSYFEKLELKRVFKVLSNLMVDEGAVYAESRKKRTGWDFIDWAIHKDPSRHWGHGTSYHENDYHKSFNARDRDKKLVKNGDVKYFRDRSGRLSRGKVYHNINNMWWVLLSDGTHTNIACSRMFDLTDNEVKLRRVVRDTITADQAARKRVGTKLYNDLKEKGVEITLQETECVHPR
jgi:hypothetical protein